jgi:DDE family transposase
MRQAVVEPVIAHIKEARGFRRFALRRLRRVRAEWQIICTAHNVLKLFRYFRPQMTT